MFRLHVGLVAGVTPRALRLLFDETHRIQSVEHTASFAVKLAFFQMCVPLIKHVARGFHQVPSIMLSCCPTFPECGCPTSQLFLSHGNENDADRGCLTEAVASFSLCWRGV